MFWCRSLRVEKEQCRLTIQGEHGYTSVDPALQPRDMLCFECRQSATSSGLICVGLESGFEEMGEKWKVNYQIKDTLHYKKMQINDIYNYVVYIYSIFVCFRARDVLRDETTSGSFKQTGIYTRSDGEWSPIQRCFIHSYDEDLLIIFHNKQLFNCCLSSVPLSALETLVPRLPRVTLN